VFGGVMGMDKVLTSRQGMVVVVVWFLGCVALG